MNTLKKDILFYQILGSETHRSTPAGGETWPGNFSELVARPGSRCHQPRRRLPAGPHPVIHHGEQLLQTELLDGATHSGPELVHMGAKCVRVAGQSGCCHIGWRVGRLCAARWQQAG